MSVYSRVEVYKWEKDADGKMQRVFDGNGEFKQYGQDYQEFEGGAAQFPIAIVEMDDGRVKSVHVDMIEFIIRKRFFAERKAQEGER